MLSRVGNLTDDSKPPPGMVAAGLGDVADRGKVPMLARGGLPPRAFRRIQEHVLAHLAETITNRALAELVGLSTFHFCRAFKQSSGVPPHRFVRRSRVERVKQLLIEIELPLSQIALTAGFADQSHCSRCFREFVGIPPSRFRWLRR